VAGVCGELCWKQWGKVCGPEGKVGVAQWWAVCGRSVCGCHAVWVWETKVCGLWKVWWESNACPCMGVGAGQCGKVMATEPKV